ncbi:hypothetical protein SKAU_G00355870 [Synaphobranchus kaupii]|uniref:Uncharacterized protein n=1 Tax=Synaphobranchus kaupii TaxID=118154 RepID=A0A9Q1EH98_SYNKA|nr:hypothetical protein SKAU_G00355870 [Synaphobranchus kaupii]
MVLCLKSRQVSPVSVAFAVSSEGSANLLLHLCIWRDDREERASFTNRPLIKLRLPSEGRRAGGREQSRPQDAAASVRRRSATETEGPALPPPPTWVRRRTLAFENNAVAAFRFKTAPLQWHDGNAAPPTWYPPSPRKSVRVAQAGWFYQLLLPRLQRDAIPGEEGRATVTYRRLTPTRPAARAGPYLLREECIMGR